jgi:hypothetical protein
MAGAPCTNPWLVFSRHTQRSAVASYDTSRCRWSDSVRLSDSVRAISSMTLGVGSNADPLGLHSLSGSGNRRPHDRRS